MTGMKTINDRRVLSLRDARVQDAARAAEIQELRDSVVGVIAIITIFIGLAMLPAIIG